MARQRKAQGTCRASAALVHRHVSRVSRTCVCAHGCRESGTLPVLLRLLSNAGPRTEATGHAAQALAQLSALQVRTAGCVMESSACSRANDAIPGHIPVPDPVPR